VTYPAVGRRPVIQPVSKHLRHPPLTSLPTTWDNLTVTPGQRSVIPQPRPTAWVRRPYVTGRPNGARYWAPAPRTAASSRAYCSS